MFLALVALLLVLFYQVQRNSLCSCQLLIFFVFLEEFEALLVWLVVVFQELWLAFLLFQSATPVHTVAIASVLQDFEIACLELRARVTTPQHAKGGLAR